MTETLKVGDKVRCGVFVIDKWVSTYVGIIVKQTDDGSVSEVDIMSLHGGRPWIVFEDTSHLMLVSNG